MSKRHVLCAGAALLGMLFALGGACGGSIESNPGGSGGRGGIGGGDGCGGDGCNYCDDVPQDCPSDTPAAYAACDAPPEPCISPTCGTEVMAGCGLTSITFWCDEDGWQFGVDAACAALCSQHATQADCADDGACRWIPAQGDLAAGCFPVTTCYQNEDCPPGSACEEHTVDGILQAVCVPCPNGTCTP